MPDGSHDDLIADPVPILKGKAVRLHEIFTALREAGFTKAQAESFVAELIPEAFNDAQDI